MKLLGQLWQFFGAGRHIERWLPSPDPEISALHARQHRLINDLQRHYLRAGSLQAEADLARRLARERQERTND